MVQNYDLTQFYVFLPDFLSLGLFLLQPFEFFFFLGSLFSPFVDVFTELFIEFTLFGFLSGFQEVSISPNSQFRLSNIEYQDLIVLYSFQWHHAVVFFLKLRGIPILLTFLFLPLNKLAILLILRIFYVPYFSNVQLKSRKVD